MSINLEQIDELRARANVSYSDARDALEACNGNILDALVYLEKHNKVRDTHEKSGFIGSIKSLLSKGNNTKFMIKKQDNVILDLSVTIMLIITACAPYIVLPVILLALFTGHRIKIAGKNGETSNTVKANETLDKISDTVDKVKKDFTQDDNTSTTE